MRVPARVLVALLLTAALVLCAAALAAQTAGKKAGPAAAKPVSPAKAPASPKKSAFDKAALEAYVRHLFLWGPQIQIAIDDPKPSAMPGLMEVEVHATAGAARQDERFYVSKDGGKFLRGVLFDIAQNPFKNELDKLKTEFQPSIGTPGASVVLVLFSDFQCPYCAQEAKMLRQNLISTFPKQVRLYFKDYPLEQIHNWAKTASIAGRCVFRQNAEAFWGYHDWIYEHQGEITAENIAAKVLEYAKTKQLDTLQLNRCLETKATEAEVNKSIAEARDLQVNQTPTLFVNGRRIPAQAGWPGLKQIIETEIEYQKTAKNAGEDCGCELTLPTPLSK